MKTTLHSTGTRFLSPIGWCLLTLLYFAVFYSLHGPRITPQASAPERFDLMAGDEPHYLMLTHSLVLDGDLDLHNNMSSRDYLIFYQGTVPDYRGGFKAFWKSIVGGRLKNVPDRYWEQHLHSICSPGLPTLLAPAYAAGYAWGHRVRYTVTIFIHLLAAILGSLTTWLAWRFYPSRFWAISIGFFITCAGPMIFYSMSIYTDLPGALCIATAIVLLLSWPSLRTVQRVPALLLLGIALGFMLWLHTKFWLHFFFLLAFAAWTFAAHPLSARREWIALILPLLVLMAGILAYYWLVFGVLYPPRTYPPFTLRSALLSGWPGLWLDQRHGLLMYLPLTLLLVPGLLVFLRDKNRCGLWITLLILIHWIATGLFSDWTGGRSPPMRYWVPILPLMAVPIAACVRAMPAMAFRILLWIAGAGGVIIGVFGMLHPRRLYAYAHPLFTYHTGGLYPRVAPLFDQEWFTRNSAAVVLCGLCIAALAWLILRKPRETTPAHNQP